MLQLSSLLATFVLGLFLLAPPLAHTNEDLFLTRGFQFIQNTGIPGAPWTSMTALGYVNQENPVYLDFSFDTHEYTFVLEVEGLSAIDTVFTFVVWTYSGGTLDVYCDPILGGTLADYGSDPPNVTSPSTFGDGEVVLGGDIDYVQIITNTSTGHTSSSGRLTLSRGSRLSNIPDTRRPQTTFDWWLDRSSPRPVGYPAEFDGGVYFDFVSLPVESRTWGSIKIHPFQ